MAIKSKLSHLILLPFACAFVQCKSERNPCLEPTVVNTNISFKVLNTGDTVLRDTTLPYLYVAGLNLDSLVMPRYYLNVSKFPISLNNKNTQTTFLIGTDSTSIIFDTLIVEHQNRLYFISNACGYTNHYTLNNFKVSKSLIDSFVLLNNDVSNDVSQDHVQLIFRR